MDDTIVAIATPPGRGAIALLRLSGPDAKLIAGKIVNPWPLKSRVATLCSIQNENKEQIDQAVVTVYNGPSSYTGEDTVEIATHGGVVAPNLVMGALLRAGAREALPGEFTRRAVLNGKLDLIQAEAVGDLIDAKSQAMHATAIRQLDGGLSERINQLRHKIIEVEALIAYDIDFPEEDDGPIDPSRIKTSLNAIKADLSNLLATAPAGEVIRSGAVVVIAGHPNAGKSSLFNAILGNNRAIVTDIPGTTRDALEATIDTKPWPIRLIDTAGLRETEDVIEKLGIEVSTRYLISADLILACGDTDSAIEDTIAQVTGYIRAGYSENLDSSKIKPEGSNNGFYSSQELDNSEIDLIPPILRVKTKSDTGNRDLNKEETLAVPSESKILESVNVSSKTGLGINELLQKIGDIIGERYGYIAVDAPMLTRERHQYAVELAQTEILEFERVWEEEQMPPIVAAVHLRAATYALEEVVGSIKLDDILDKLFSSFCVGK